MQNSKDIAIIGLSCKFPEANNQFDYWANIKKNKNSVCQIPKERWNWQDCWGDPKDKGNVSNSRWGGFIEDADAFDNEFFGLIPKVVDAMDPQQRIMLELTWKCLEDAGIPPSRIRGEKIGLIFSAFNHDYKALQESGIDSPIEAHHSTGNASSIIANRVSHYFDLKGPSLLIDTACSGSLNAIHCAVQALEFGDCEMAFAGGVNLIFTPTRHISFSKMGMMSPTGTCRSFDKDANGYVRGEGAGVVLLKPLSRAKSDGDSIYGVIKGTAVNHCGETYTMTYPSPEAQADVIVDAHTRAGVSIDTISYIESHGTGTPKGDPIEFAGLESAFLRLASDQGVELDNNYCGIGSAKSNVGHLESAAGIAGVIKVLMQLRARELPAVHHFSQLNPKIDINNTPFYVVDKKRKWKPKKVGKGKKGKSSRLLRAGVSSFGFGGTNAHIVIEEAPKKKKLLDDPTSNNRSLALYPIPFSAKTELALKQKICEFREFLYNADYCQLSSTDLIDLSYSLAVGREHFSHRAVFLCKSMGELLEQLTDIENNLDIWTSPVPPADVSGKRTPNVVALARAYLSGDITDWSSVYRKKQVSILRLPTYPFAKTRFWITNNTLTPVASKQLHPLLHENISDFECQRFRSEFSGSEYFLDDHRVDDEPVLPGAAYIEMVLQAVVQSSGMMLDEYSLELKDVAWLRPIKKANCQFLSVSLYPLQADAELLNSTPADPAMNNIEFEISSHLVDDKVVVHCQGRVSAVYSGSAEPELSAVEKFCDQRESIIKTASELQCDHQRFYTLMNSSGLAYGDTHKGVTQLHLTERQAIAHVQLPFKLDDDDRSKYLSHPALLDAVIQSAVALAWSGECQKTSERALLFSSNELVTSVRAHLPFLLNRAQINAALGDSLCVFLELLPSESDGVQAFDIVVANLDDQQQVLNIAMKLNGLMLRTLQDSAGSDAMFSTDHDSGHSMTMASESLETQLLADLSFDNREGYYTPRWIAQPVVPDFHWQDQTEAVVLCLYGASNKDNITHVIQELKQPGVTIIHLLLDDECRTLNEECVASIRAASDADINQLVTALKGRNISPTHVLHLPSQLSDSADIKHQDKIKSAINTEVATIFLLAKSLIKRSKTLRLLTVAEGELFTQPQLLALSGFYKTLHLEKPVFDGRVVQIEQATSQSLRSLIMDEFTDGSMQTDIAYSDGQRYVRDFNDCSSTLKSAASQDILPAIASELSPSNALFKTQGVYVITGGMGALGLVFARYLMQSYEAKVFLTGRSDLSDSMRQQLTALNTLPGQAHYLPCDVNDFESVQLAISQVRSSGGALDGILHSAGVIEDSFIIKKSVRSFLNVVTPKSLGTVHLDLATAKDKLSCFVLFSSVSGVLGNLGQCDYAYGNAFEDYFSQHRNLLVSKGRRCGKSVSINWPYWRNGGMTLTDKEEEILNRNFGIMPLETDDGIAALEKALQFPMSQLAVLPGNVEKVREVLGCQSDVGTETTAVQVVPERPVVSTHDLTATATDYLCELFSEELQVPSDRFTLNASFNEQGFDSVIMLDIIDRMGERFDDLPKTLLFEYQTLKDLSTYLAENYAAQLTPEAPVGQSAVSTPSQAQAPQPISSESIGNNRRRLARASLYASQVSTVTEQLDNRIAVVGLAGRYPEAGNVDEFWKNIAEGRDCVREIPKDRWDIDKLFQPGESQSGKSYSKWGGFLDNIDCFDAPYFNISPKEAEKLDPQERLFLEVVSHAIEDAGYHPENLVERRSDNHERPVGVYTGVMWGDYQLHGTESNDSDNWTSPRSFYWSVANRVSYFFNFSGPSIALDTACSSSMTAIHLACQAILGGEVSVAIAGGVNLSLHAQKYNLLSDMHFLSADGRCRSFGEGGSGYVPGECVSAMVLKPLAVAEQDGDHIYGVIRGTAMNHGGKASGFTVPNQDRQAALIRDAMEKAKVDPSNISYVEAHGTGTGLGDPLEIRGLTKAYAQREKQYCAIGSVKSNIGHPEAAGAIAGLTKVLLQMKHKTLVPSLHSEVLNPHIEFTETPFKVNRESRPWDRPVVVDEDGVETEIPRIAGLSSFGAGGTNGHVIVEEYEPAPRIGAGSGSTVLVPLSAKSQQALHDGVTNLFDHLNENPHLDLTGVAYTLQTGRVEFGWRMAVIADSLPQLIQRLGQFSKAAEDTDGVFFNTSVIKPAKDLKGKVPESLAIDASDTTLAALASEWVSGQPVAWTHFYGTNTPRRVPLPGYAYQRRRYWIENNTPVSGEMPKLHPVLSQNLSTLHSVAYRSCFNPSDFYIKNHQINDNGVLPGVVYLEMACQAITHALPESQLESIYDVEWLKPVVVNAGTESAAYITSIDEDSFGYTFTVYQENDLTRQAFCRGNFGVIPADVLSNEQHLATIRKELDSDGIGGHSFDLNELKHVGTEIPVERLNASFETMGFNFGESFRPFTGSVITTSDSALARLCLPAQVAEDTQEFTLNPVLLDGALRTCVAIALNEQEVGVTPLPVGLSRLQLFNSLESVVYVYARKVTVGSETQGRDRFNIHLLDEQGNVLIFLEAFETQKVTGFLAQQHNSIAKVKLPQQTESVQQSNPVKPLSSAATSSVNAMQLAIVAYLKDLIAENTHSSVNDLDEHEPIDTFGLESLMVHRMNEKLNDTFGDCVSKTLFYEHDSIADLAAYLVEQFPKAAATLLRPEQGGALGVTEVARLDTTAAHASVAPSSDFPEQDNATQLMEHFLVTEISTVTGMPVDELSATDPFDTFGINSLMISTLNERIAQVFGQDVSKTLFYEFEDIESMAEYFTVNHSDGIAKLPPSEVHSIVPEVSTVGSNQSDTSELDTKVTLIKADESKDSIKTELRHYLFNVVSRILGRDSDSAYESEFYLDDVNQIRFNFQLRKDLGIDVGSSVLHAGSIDALSQYLLAYKSIDRDALNLTKRSKEDNSSTLASGMPEAEVLQVQSQERDTHAIRKRLSSLLQTQSDSPLRQVPIRNTEPSHDDIAIIGLSGRYPLADDLAQFWDNLRTGRDCIREVPEERWDIATQFIPDRSSKGTIYSKWGGFMDDVDLFDAEFFRMTRREAEIIDPQERIFLQTAWMCLEDAAYTRQSLHDSSVGVFVGVMWGDYQLIDVSEEQKKFGRPTAAFSSIPNRVSYFFDLHGPSLAIDTMCSSSISAIHTACQSIRSGDCDYAIAGGVNISAHVNKYQLLCQQQFLADDGRCRAFGAGGSGYVPGEGAGAVLLKKLQQAEADGDNIYAVIKGSALNHGGKTSGFTVPNQRAQSNVISKALQQSGWTSDSIQYVEAHGTGTSLGDPIEVSGLTRAWTDTDSTDISNTCYLGSVKSNIGHLESAAGIAGLTKVLMQMQHGTIAPSLHSSELNPNLTMHQNCFEVPQQATVWNRPTDDGGREQPRRAGLSAFGAGGSNSHLLIEEYIANDTQASAQNYLFLLSADSPDRLLSYVEKVSAFLDGISFTDTYQGLSFLRNLSFSSIVGREHKRCRIAAVCSTLEGLQNQLLAFLDGKSAGGLIVNTGDGAKLTDLVDEHTQDDLLQSLLESGQTEGLARLWVAAMDIDWLCHAGKLFVGSRPVRISMPSQPLSLERHWVDEMKVVKNASVVASVHPMLDNNISTIPQQAFSKTLTGDEFYVKDHLVENEGPRKILPGVAYLEMARAAAAMSVPTDLEVRRIRDVIWFAPIQIDQTPQTVKLSLSVKGDALEYHVTDLDNESRLYSSGEIDFRPAASDVDVQPLDIDNIKAQAGITETRDHIYKRFSEMGFHYGPDYQVTDWRQVMGSTALARLSLPKNLRAQLDEFVLHPSLMDGALRTCLAVADDKFLSPMVPFSLGEIEILRPLTAECFVYVSTNALRKENDSGSDTQHYDLVITDLKGNVQVRIRQLSARSFNPTKKTDSLNYYRYDWLASKAGKQLPGQITGMLGFLDSPDQASYCLATNDSTPSVWVVPGERFEALSDSIYALNVSDVSDMERLFAKLSNDGFSLSHIVNLQGRFGEQAGVWFELGDGRVADQETRQSLSLVYSVFQGVCQHYSNSDVRFIDIDVLHDGRRCPLKASLCGFANSMIGINHLFQLASLSMESKYLPQLHSVLQVLINDSRINGREFKYSADSDTLEERTLVPDALTGDPEKSLIKKGGTCIITGGLGKLGLAISEHLIKSRQCNLALVSRRDPSEEQLHEIGRLENLLQAIRPQGKIIHIQADVSSRASVDYMYRCIAKQFDEIDCVIHAAGVASDVSVLDLSQDEFLAGASAKLQGLIHLDAAGRAYDLKLIVNFSSVSTQLGDLGSGSYAAGNRFMDEYACNFASGNTRMISINWPLWQSGGLQIPESEIAAMRYSGMAPMPEADGIEAFENILNGSDHNVFLIYGDKKRIENKFSVNRHCDKLPDSTIREANDNTSAKIKQREMDVMEPVKVRGNDLAVVAQWVKQCVAGITRQDVERINDTDSFESFGMDSVLMMECQQTIADMVNGLPKTILFEQDSIEKLSHYLLVHKFADLPSSLQLDIDTSDDGQANPTIITTQSSSLPQAEPDGDFTKPVALKQAAGFTQDDLSISALYAKNDSDFSAAGQSEQFQGSSPMAQSMAITGLAGRFPESEDLHDFWGKVVTGENCISSIPANRWSVNDAKAQSHDRDSKSIYGGYLSDVDHFDHTFFGLSHLEAASMDPQLRVLLETVWHAIEDAGYTKQDLSRREVGVFIGAMNNDHTHVVENLSAHNNAYISAGSVDSELANRISFFLDIFGPSVTVKTACSSSMTALHLACNAINAGDCEMAIVAGVNLSLHQHKYRMLDDMKVLSQHNREKTFDLNADGLVPSEGVGAIIIRPESGARNDNDNIHALIRATAISHSGVGAGQFIPNINVLEKTIQRCMDKSGIEADSLQYIESHGTATALGDPIELRAIENVASSNCMQTVHIGTKANLGHMEAASALCSIIKVVLSAKHGVIAPCANLTEVSDAIEADTSPLVLNAESIAWQADANGCRVAGINSFGMGGSNGFAIIECRQQAVSKEANPAEVPVVVFSAESDDQLLQLLKSNLKTFSIAARNPGQHPLDLSSIAFTSQCGRQAFSHRIAIVARDVDQLISTIERYIEKGISAVNNVVRATCADQSASRVVELLNRLSGIELYQRLSEQQQWFELAKLWANGLNVDWANLYSGSLPAKASLANYPFKAVDCNIHSALAQIISAQRKKTNSRNAKSKASTVVEFSGNSDWYHPRSQVSTPERSENVVDTELLQAQAAQFWQRHSAHGSSLLCSSMAEKPIGITGLTTPCSQVISGSTVSDLRNLSAEHKLQLTTLCAASLAVVLSRNTKVKNPSFGLLDSSLAGFSDDAQILFPFSVKTAVKIKCLPWLQALQGEMQLGMQFSRTELISEDLKDLLRNSEGGERDTALLVTPKAVTVEPGSVSAKCLFQVAYSHEQIQVSLHSLDNTVLDTEMARILDEFVFVLTNLMLFIDKLPGAIPVRPNKAQIQSVIRRLEGV